jgi:hypothetical protein
MHPVEVQEACVVWNLLSVRLETVLVLVQYRCTVCAERTIGSEMVFDAPDDEAQVEACLSPFEDSANLEAR